jgi:hypothetical protein
MPDEETQEFPVAEADDVDPPADLGPWGAEAVRLSVDTEPAQWRANAGRDSARPTQHRWATAGALGLAAVLIGALIVTALPPDPDNDTTARPPNPANKRDVASVPRASRPKPAPRRAERNPTPANIKTRKPDTRARAAPAPAPQPSPTYLPSPAPPPPSEPVTPSPAPAPTAEGGTAPTSPPQPASGAAVAEEFGFER